MALTPFGFPSVFNDFLDRPLLIPNNSRSGSVRRSGRSMHVDLTEDAKAFHVKADLPGVKKDDIKVNLDGNVLTLSVQQQNTSDKEEERNGVKWHCMERSSQFVQRVVPLPDSADVKAIKAKYSDGVLHLDIGKKTEEAQRVQSIAID